MATIQYEVLEAFRAAGVPEEQAARAAEAVASGDIKRLDKIDGRLDGLDGLDGKVDKLALEMTASRLDMAAIRGEQALMKWMLATVLAGVLAITLKLFVHA